MSDVRLVDSAGRLLPADALLAQREMLPEAQRGAFDNVVESVRECEAAESALRIAESDCAQSAARLRLARDKLRELRGPDGFHALWKATFSK